MPARTKITLLLVLAALAAGAGCGPESGPLAPETDEPLYREGQQWERQGRTEQALNAYLKLIAERGDQAPQSHLEAGILYLGTFKDPVEAIHHFHEYLKLEPNSVQATYVRGQIDAARREFASSLPAPSWESGGQSSELSDQVAHLQSENAALKAELASLRGTAGSSVTINPTPVEPVPETPDAVAVVPAPPAPPLEAAPAPVVRPETRAAPSARVHVVVKGDTLYNLAQRYYGNRARWRDILAANRDQLGGATTLHLGMQLRLP